MTRPKLLDLFCCEGGAGRGYERAGFDVYGVDLFKHDDENGKRVGFSQDRYPFVSRQDDALLVLRDLLAGVSVLFGDEALWLGDFSAIHASPPCQKYSITKHTHNKTHADLVGPVRDLLRATGLPYVIENVVGAPLDAPLTLCGTEFGLTTTDDDGTPLHLRRHRLFESNVYMLGAGGCQCTAYKRRGYQVGGAYGGGSDDRRYAKDVRRGGYTPPKHVREALLGIDWMTLDGLSQAIPPAYTQYVGTQLLASIRGEQVAS